MKTNELKDLIMKTSEIKNVIKVNIRVKTYENGSLPERKHLYDAGSDLKASEQGEILPGEFKMIPTDIAMEIPSHLYGHIQSRSGLASKKGIFVLTGTIDANYRGKIWVVLGNFGNEPFTYEVGDRIAQIVFMEYVTPNFHKVDELSDSERGENGYGSTGVK